MSNKRTTHGHSSGGISPTYYSWSAMKRRCDATKASDYSRYGGRGITYDSKWKDFPAFLADMGERPEGMTLDREDNDGPYCKDNCRWATHRQQACNKSDSHKVPGVARRKAGKFRAYTRVNGKAIDLGTHKEEWDAICARKSWESTL